MSIKVLIGDLFTSKMQTWTNTVNTVGVMGKGIALEFRKRFPEMYNDYIRRCDAGQLKLGQPYLYRQLTPPLILNFPTKDHWRSVTRLDDIVRGLKFLSQHYKEWGITSLAVPPLGCGEGRLEWRVVGPTLYRHLVALDIPIELYAPFQTPHEELTPVFLEQSVGEKTSHLPPARINPAWIALAEIISRIDDEPYHWPIGRTLFQKIAYFATQAGIPTGLRYERGSYGPYSAEMKPIISALVNNSVLEERRTSPEARMLQVRPGPTFHDACKAYVRDLETWEDAIAKTVDLFLRLEKTRNAELAATVHFAARGLEGKAAGARPTELDILDAVKSWKQRRKPPFQDKEIALTIRSLATLSWLHPEASENLPVSEEEFLSA